MGTAQYDLAGNLTRDSATPTPMNFVYDGENRQTSAGTTTYTYDGAGRRVKKVVSGTTNTYVYDVMGRLVAEYLPSATPGPVYLTADHLGSTRVATDQTASIVERHDFLPFGEEIPVSASAYGNRAGIPGYGTDTIRQKFTAMEADGETSLDFFKARYQSGAAGRFMSVDSAGPDLASPQTFNRYRYGLNNPLRFVDRNGLYEEDVHRDLTRILAVAAGFLPSDTLAIATANQLTDDNPATGPLTLREEGTGARAQYHFTTEARRDQMWLDFRNTGSMDALGQYLHAQQDSFSHGGYGPLVGHGARAFGDAALTGIVTSSPGVLNEAAHLMDKTYGRPELADRMAQDTFLALIVAKVAVGSSARHVLWNDIAPMGPGIQPRSHAPGEGEGSQHARSLR